MEVFKQHLSKKKKATHLKKLKILHHYQYIFFWSDGGLHGQGEGLNYTTNPSTGDRTWDLLSRNSKPHRAEEA